jgi:hypothetical protein
MLIPGDSITALRHYPPAIMGGAASHMSSARFGARWSEAVWLTTGLWLFVLLIFLPAILQRHARHSWGSVALDASTVLLSIGLGLLLFALFRATISRPPPFRIAVVFSAVIAAALFNTAFDLLFQGWVAENLDAAWRDLPGDIQRGYSSAFNYFMVFTINIALFQLSFARSWAANQQRRLGEARAAAQQAKLEALRFQLNPHFLFNTLNSISSLIVTRRNEDAERMTHKLSSFLRSSLACDPTRLVPLDEELSLIEEYLDIEAVRFGARLDAVIDCDPSACSGLVPGFLVQPLVENAIKHGVAPSRDPVRILIHAAVENGALCITVENDVPAPSEGGEPAEGAGVGLQNVRRRLEAVYGKSASLTITPGPASYRATICIPEVQSPD